MRVVSWNLAYWKPGRYKTVANRRRQWALLAALQPDIALLQECRPEDHRNLAPSWMSEEYRLYGAIPDGWTACSAALVRATLPSHSPNLTGLPGPAAAWLQLLSGRLAITQVQLGEVAATVVSVHADAAEVKDGLTADDHTRLRRPALARAWYPDLVVGALEPLTAGGNFIVGGDWNEARLWDQTTPQHAPGSQQFFEGRAEAGWFDALRKHSPDEVRTYLDRASAPYELDHVFVDATQYGQLTASRPLSEEMLTELSDHAPLVLDFAEG